MDKQAINNSGAIGGTDLNRWGTRAREMFLYTYMQTQIYIYI